MDAVFEMSLLCMEQDLNVALEADIGGTLRRIVNTVIDAIIRACKAIGSFACNCYRTFKAKIAQIRKKKDAGDYKNEGIGTNDSELSAARNELIDAMNYVDQNVSKYLDGTATWAVNVMKMVASGKPISDEAFHQIEDDHNQIKESSSDSIEAIKRLHKAITNYTMYPVWTTEIINKMDKINDLFNSIYQTYDGILLTVTHFAKKANDDLFAANGTPDMAAARDHAVKTNRIAAYIENSLSDAKKVIVSFGGAFSQLLQAKFVP